MRYLLSFSFLFHLLFATDSRAENWGTEWDQFVGKPGTVVTYPAPATASQRAEGVEFRNIRLENGITVHQTRKKGRVSSFPVDNSGHGAVMCVWFIYNSIKATLQTCQDEKYQGVIKRLEHAVSRINHFIVENSLTPTSLEQLEEQARRYGERQSSIKQTNKSGEVQKSCPDKGMAHFVNEMQNLSETAFNKRIDDLLSVPRPPVSNPCL